MLSQKLQDDLMTAYQKVYEEKRGHAAGSSDVEKQASQLASDVRYKAKGKVKPGASEEEKKFYKECKRDYKVMLDTAKKHGIKNPIMEIPFEVDF